MPSRVPHNTPTSGSTSQAAAAAIERAGGPTSSAASPRVATTAVVGTRASAVPAAKEPGVTDLTPAPWLDAANVITGSRRSTTVAAKPLRANTASRIRSVPGPQRRATERRPAKRTMEKEINAHAVKPATAFASPGRIPNSRPDAVAKTGFGKHIAVPTAHSRKNTSGANTPLPSTHRRSCSGSGKSTTTAATEGARITTTRPISRRRRTVSPNRPVHDLPQQAAYYEPS